MRKGVLLVLLGAIAIVASSRAGYAQSIYPVKFVCGTQRPNARLVAPAEPPVKPGNYATVINVQSFASDNQAIPTRVSLADSVTAVGPSLTLSFLQTGDITCADIANALSTVSTNGFITGYVDVIARGTVAVTAVYTSQGCAFPLTNLAVIPPVCTGATSIDVVPQQPLTLPTGAAIPGS